MHISYRRSAFMHFFHLPLSAELLHLHPADALWWHLCEWGLRGWDSRWCLDDRPLIAVMCGVHSQQGPQWGIQGKEIVPSCRYRAGGGAILTNVSFLDLTRVLVTFVKSQKRLQHTNFVSIWRPYRRPLRNIPSGNWNPCLCPGSTFVKICISWHCNNGISGLKCLLYFSALESKLNYPWTLHCLQRKAADKPAGSTQEMWTRGELDVWCCTFRHIIQENTWR